MLRQPTREKHLPDLVLMEQRGATMLLTLNRPKALNALSSDMLRAFSARLFETAEALRGADGPKLRAVVVTGAGRAFAAGADIAEMRTMNPQQARNFSRLGHDTMNMMADLPLPVIAAVDGFAFGGGMELSLACDWIYASRQARFGQPEVKLGLLPGFGGSSRLPRHIGKAWASELIMGGEPIDAETAQRIGLVNRVFETREALMEAALDFGDTLADKGPLAVAAAKRVLQSGADADLGAANALEQEAFGSLFATEDREEGLDAFLAKRAPRFRRR